MKKTFWKSLFQRFWRYAGSVNVRTKILGIVIGGTLLLSVGLTLQMRQAVGRITQAELEARGRLGMKGDVPMC